MELFEDHEDDWGNLSWVVYSMDWIEFSDNTVGGYFDERKVF